MKKLIGIVLLSFLFVQSYGMGKDTTIVAKFVEFSWGDFPHLIFEDAAENQYDFGGGDNKTGDFQFETDEGESNTEMEGKWFEIKYTTIKVKFMDPESEEMFEEDALSILEMKRIKKE
jgi:hypothetical protein